MTTMHTRTTAAELEVRSDGDGRTVEGLAVPWDTPTLVRDARSPRAYLESFTRGAFGNAAREAHRVKFYVNHAHRGDPTAVPVGVALELRDDVAGLVGSFAIAKTAAGDEALELIRSRVLDGLSVGFVPDPKGDRWTPSRDAVVRTRAELYEVSAVGHPAYRGAMVSAVRRGNLEVVPAWREVMLRRRHRAMLDRLG